MSAALQNATTQAQYDAPRTLSCPGTARLRIQVSNAAILIQVGRSERRGGLPAWDEGEAVLLPVLASLEQRCDAVRVRSLVAAAPAQVSIWALTAEEVGGG